MLDVLRWMVMQVQTKIIISQCLTNRKILDRLIYFYKSQEGIQDWRILDGDHIAALFLRFILEVKE